MNKKSLLYILLDLVFLVVFNVVFFVIGGAEHVASVWIAYGFIHFAYLMILVTPFLIRKSSSSAVFGMSIYSVSATYFFVEFVVGLIFIFIASDSYKASLVVQVIIAGIYAVILLANLIANEHTADNVAKHEAEVAYIKNTAAELKALIGKASDKRANKEIEKAYDVVHASPTKSSSVVVGIEKSIYCAVAELRDAVKNNDTAQTVVIAKEIAELTEERNRKLRLVK
jgi:signal transduction histidine kinase